MTKDSSHQSHSTEYIRSKLQKGILAGEKLLENWSEKWPGDDWAHSDFKNWNLDNLDLLEQPIFTERDLSSYKHITNISGRNLSKRQSIIYLTMFKNDN